LKKEKAHFPLVFMLVLSQMAAGLFVGLEAFSLAGLLPEHPVFQAWGHGLGAFLMFLAIAVSVTHLGRPLYAFRAVIGFRRSWLSREIVAFGLLGGLAGAAAAGSALSALAPSADSWMAIGAIGTAPWMCIALIVASLAAIHCSAMVYRDTPRLLWATRLTSAKFILSGALTGMAGILLLAAGFDLSGAGTGPYAAPLALWLCVAIPLASASKLACESRVQRHLDDQEANPLKKAG